MSAHRLFLTAFAALSVVACGGASPLSRTATATAPTPTVAAPASAAAVDPPPAQDGDVTVGSVAGIPVLVKRVPGAAFAAGQLYIRGGTRNWTASNAGIEQLALSVAASGGTHTLDKPTFARKQAALGMELYPNSGNDQATFAMKAPLSAWDDAFALMVDAFENPALPASEVELVRQQSLQELHHEDEDPDDHLWVLHRKEIFAGHPYLNRAIGTVDTMTALKQEDLGPYLEKLRVRSRLVFVAAGDLDPAHVFDQVKHAFGALPQGDYTETTLPAYTWTKSNLVTQERKLPTNYVESAFVMPGWNDPDFVTGRVAVHALSNRIWEEVRTKRNLAYAVYAAARTDFTRPFGIVYFTAVDANTTMKVVLDEISKLKTVPIADTELAGYKSVFLTGYLLAHETVNGQANVLGQAWLDGGDWRVSRSLPDRVRAVTAQDIQAFAQKYMVHLQAAVMGDPTKIDSALFTSL